MVSEPVEQRARRLAQKIDTGIMAPDQFPIVLIDLLQLQ